MCRRCLTLDVGLAALHAVGLSSQLVEHEEKPYHYQVHVLGRSGNVRLNLNFLQLFFVFLWLYVSRVEVVWSKVTIFLDGHT